MTSNKSKGCEENEWIRSEEKKILILFPCRNADDWSSGLPKRNRKPGREKEGLKRIGDGMQIGARRDRLNSRRIRRRGQRKEGLRKLIQAQIRDRVLKKGNWSAGLFRHPKKKLQKGGDAKKLGGGG